MLSARVVAESLHLALKFVSHRSRRVKPPSQVCSGAGCPRMPPSTWAKARTSQPGVAATACTKKERPMVPSTRTMVTIKNQASGGAHRAS